MLDMRISRLALDDACNLNHWSAIMKVLWAVLLIGPHTCTFARVQPSTGYTMPTSGWYILHCA